jgi:NAD(P)-dependent dehydrogenase (short-subunit alcohol dehydrogenase family)
MDLQLRGKRAIVTGGSRGIGLATADTLAAEGCDIALVSRTPSAEAVDRVARHGTRVLAVAADTTDSGSVEAMVAQVVAELGGVDVLVNAAAQPASSGPQSSASTTTDEMVREQFETKVLGYLRCARAVAPHMTAQGFGRIVNVSGLNARGSSSLVGSVRNVSVAALTAALADELGPQGVTVTVVHPGLTVTERTPGMIAAKAEAEGTTLAEAERALGRSSRLGRLVTAQEVADVITFLASPRSAAVNGDAVAAGGGQPGVTYY